MSRPPKPWFVTIDGTRHFLAADKEAALTRFHQLMAEPQKRVVRSDSLTAIIDLFLDWCQKYRAADTYEWYRYLNNNWDALLLSTTDGRLPIDNNETEHLMKQIATGRKNCLHIGSLAAGARSS